MQQSNLFPLSYHDVTANRETFLLSTLTVGLPACARPPSLSPSPLSQWAPLSANGIAGDGEKQRTTTTDRGRGEQSRPINIKHLDPYLKPRNSRNPLSFRHVLATLFPFKSGHHMYIQAPRGEEERGRAAAQPRTKNKTWLLPSPSPARGRNDQVLRGVSLRAPFLLPFSPFFRRNDDGVVCPRNRSGSAAGVAGRWSVASCCTAINNRPPSLPPSSLPHYLHITTTAL